MLQEFGLGGIKGLIGRQFRPHLVEAEIDRADFRAFQDLRVGAGIDAGHILQRNGVNHIDFTREKRRHTGRCGSDRREDDLVEVVLGLAPPSGILLECGAHAKLMFDNLERTSAIGIDKSVQKKLMINAGFNSPTYFTIDRNDWINGNTKGVWEKAKNLGAPINSARLDYCPFVYKGLLYFTSDRPVPLYTQDKKLTLKEFKAKMDSWGNGADGDIYTVSITQLINSVK